MASPQGLIDAQNAVQAAKDAADSALLAKNKTAAALVQAKSADDAAQAEIATRTTALSQALSNLRAVEDAYFKAGAQPPVT